MNSILTRQVAATTGKTNFKKEYKAYYSPKPQKPEVITIPAMQYVVINGQGDPNNSKEFQDAISALYGLVFTMKFSRKKAGLTDFTTGPLEALWWMAGGGAFDDTNKSDWLWALMMWVPDSIGEQEFKDTLQILMAKKYNPTLRIAKLEKLDESTVVQIMHIGPYEEEQPSLDLMLGYAGQNGYEYSGKHHEVYLGDPRRAAPEKLRTILRQRVTKLRASTMNNSQTINGQHRSMADSIR